MQGLKLVCCQSVCIVNAVVRTNKERCRKASHTVLTKQGRWTYDRLKALLGQRNRLYLVQHPHVVRVTTATDSLTCPSHKPMNQGICSQCTCSFQ